MNHLTFKDKLIPWYFVVFFAIVALVDGVMVTLAVRTNSGLVTDHAYEKGLAYNQIVSAKNAQDALGWDAETSWDGVHLNVRLRDRQHAEIKPETILAHFTRPAKSGMDFKVDLLERGGRIAFPAKGVWDVRLFITSQGREFQQTRRLMIE